MYLRDLAVFSSTLEDAKDYERAFNVSTHIVVEPVLAWIPRNKVTLDDLAKLNVVVGCPQGACNVYEKWQEVGTYCVPEFDFNHYADLGETAQQELVLELLRSAFRFVAKESGSDASLCFDAVQKVANTGLPLPRLNTERFWISLPPQKRRSKLYRDDIEFSAWIIDRDQHSIVSQRGGKSPNA